MLQKLSCQNTWLWADCHIIFIAYTVLLLQTQIRVIPVKFWVVYARFTISTLMSSLTKKKKDVRAQLFKTNDVVS